MVDGLLVSGRSRTWTRGKSKPQALTCTNDGQWGALLIVGAAPALAEGTAGEAEKATAAKPGVGALGARRSRTRSREMLQREGKYVCGAAAKGQARNRDAVNRQG